MGARKKLFLPALSASDEEEELATLYKSRHAEKLQELLNGGLVVFVRHSMMICLIAHHTSNAGKPLHDAWIGNSWLIKYTST